MCILANFALCAIICSDYDLSVEKLCMLIRKNILFQEKNLFCMVEHANLWKGSRHLCKYKLVSFFICSWFWLTGIQFSFCGFFERLIIGIEVRNFCLVVESLLENKVHVLLENKVHELVLVWIFGWLTHPEFCFPLVAIGDVDR